MLTIMRWEGVLISSELQFTGAYFCFYYGRIVTLTEIKQNFTYLNSRATLLSLRGWYSVFYKVLITSIINNINN